MSEANYPKVYLYQRIVKAKLYIDSHYNEQIDLDNISDEAYFSKFHFIRTFKKIYGKTPHQYLTSVRIDKAKSLLKDGTAISMACCEVGFESITSFSGLFKKYTGYTPSEYQQQQLHLLQLAIARPQQFVPGCFGHALGYFEKSNFQEAKLAIVPFYAFGADKKSPWYRLSVGTAKLEEIPQMFTQLEAALAKLS